MLQNRLLNDEQVCMHFKSPILTISESGKAVEGCGVNNFGQDGGILRGVD